MVLLELKKPQEAVTALQRATEIDSSSAEAYAGLALAWDRLLQWEKAVTAFEKSLTLRPADPRTLLNLGFALSRLDRRAELDAWIEKAIAAEPEMATLHAMLAAQYFAFGRIDDAVRAMERNLALDPMDIRAHAFMSDMKQFTPGDPHLAALEQFVSQSAILPAEERSIARYTLGKAYSDLGRHDESFEQYVHANRLRRSMINYDITQTLSGFERIKAVFTPDLMQAKRGMGDPSERPVFIVGVMRSGTTLVEQIISAHSRVYGWGETPNFADVVGQVTQSYPELVARLSRGELRQIGEMYLQRAEAGACDAARITDKTLSNDLFVGLIHLALPNARIINVVRDPIDTCLSNFAMNFGTIYPFTCDLSELGRWYRAERLMMEHWRKLLPEDRFLEVRYEDIVADIEGQARRLLRFCALEWDPACLSFNESRRPVWTGSAAQVRRPLYDSSVGRWRPAIGVLRPLLDGLGEYASLRNPS